MYDNYQSELTVSIIPLSQQSSDEPFPWLLQFHFSFHLLESIVPASAAQLSNGL